MSRGVEERCGRGVQQRGFAERFSTGVQKEEEEEKKKKKKKETRTVKLREP